MILLRSVLALSLVPALIAPISAAERWQIQYLYDQTQSRLTLVDLKFPSERRGIAAGFITEKEKVKPTVLITNDGGRNWTQVGVKDIPLSLFFLDDSIGWMVTQKGLWQTEESGRSWHKIKSPKEVQRVWFVTREHGWAVGARKSAFETLDGGESWTEVAAARELKANPDYTTLSVINFASPQRGLIAGSSQPPRSRADHPEWMDPEAAKSYRQWPSLSLFLETRDGGKTWAGSTASVFGQVTSLSFLPNGVGLSLVEFSDFFDWPCEVYKVEPGKAKGLTRSFRDRNSAITDVLLTAAGTGYLVGPRLIGSIRNNPIPGKLKIYTSRDLSDWSEMAIDYRAEAHRAVFASPNADNIWVATDTGMILKLESK